MLERFLLRRRVERYPTRSNISSDGSSDRISPPEAAHDWAVSRWAVIEQYHWTKPAPLYSRASRLVAASLRNTLTYVVEKIEDPATFLAE